MEALNQQHDDVSTREKKSNSVGGRKVICANCREKIAVNKEIRVTTIGIMKGEARGAYLPITVSFHAKPSCLLEWMNRGNRVRLIPFDHKISIAPSTEKLLTPSQKIQLEDLSNNGISVLTQIPFNSYDFVSGILDFIQRVFIVIILVFR